MSWQLLLVNKKCVELCKAVDPTRPIVTPWYYTQIPPNETHTDLYVSVIPALQGIIALVTAAYMHLGVRKQPNYKKNVQRNKDICGHRPVWD
jgi:hypothetical protein